MTTIIVLFNLKSESDHKAYEHWASTTDLPTVRALSSCNSFDLFRTQGVLGSDQPAPYQYIEQIEVNDMETFGTEVKSETMQAVAAEFRTFADQPIFMLSECISR